MNTEFLLKEQFKNDEEYFKIYIALTTTNAFEVKIDDKTYFSGLSYNLCNVTYFTLSNPSEIIENKYWRNYTWIWDVAFDEDFNEVIKKSYHFKMINDKEVIYPPIPKICVEFYQRYLK